MRAKDRRPAFFIVAWTASFGAATLAGAGRPSEQAAVAYQGLSFTTKTLERATNVSLQDCPPGANAVRGVIRPTETNEFVTVEIEVDVLPSFAPRGFPKPVLYDDGGAVYKTAQAFGELTAGSSYSCSFSFRVPKGTKVSKLSIGEAALDLTEGSN